jgi:hypothetical protein
MLILPLQHLLSLKITLRCLLFLHPFTGLDLDYDTMAFFLEESSLNPLDPSRTAPGGFTLYLTFARAKKSLLATLVF